MFKASDGYNVEYSEAVSCNRNSFKVGISNHKKTELSPKEHCDKIKEALSKYIDQYTDKYGDNKTKCYIYFSLECENK